jgi:hypothetical protein
MTAVTIRIKKRMLLPPGNRRRHQAWLRAKGIAALQSVIVKKALVVMRSFLARLIPIGKNFNRL